MAEENDITKSALSAAGMAMSSMESGHYLENTKVMKRILLLADLSSVYGRKLLQGIVQYSKEHGPWTFFHMPLYYCELYGDAAVVQWAKKWKADAVIAHLATANIDELRKLEIPAIIHDYKESTNKIYNMTGEYFKTGEMAAKFFLNRGFKNFAFYGSEDRIWSRGRAHGFRSCIEAQGYSLLTLNSYYFISLHVVYAKIKILWMIPEEIF